MTQTRELVYGRRPVHEVLRAGRREVIEVLATERARSSEPWLEDVKRIRTEPERVLTDASHTRDHQGVIAFCEPYRYVDAYELAAGPKPLIVCLDQVTDPHNLGAVVPQRRGARARPASSSPSADSARVTPAVCRASAGAVEHLPVAVVVNLARYLEETKGADLWAWATETRGANPGLVGGPDAPGVVPRARLRGPGNPARACAAPATTRSRFRSAARSSR